MRPNTRHILVLIVAISLLLAATAPAYATVTKSKSTTVNKVTYTATDSATLNTGSSCSGYAKSSASKSVYYLYAYDTFVVTGVSLTTGIFADKVTASASGSYVTAVTANVSWSRGWHIDERATAVSSNGTHKWMQTGASTQVTLTNSATES